MSRATTSPPASSPETIRLRVFRVAEGTTQVLRMGSPSIDGLFTHRHDKNGWYCQGDGKCNPPLHRLPSIWKGYVYAHLLQPCGKKWQPVALELTENLEGDMRYVYAPGQVWECFRRPKEGKKLFPCEGKLLSETDPLPNAKQVNIIPHLRTFYHCPTLVLGQKNPMPDRVMVEILESVQALFLIPKDELPQLTPEEIEKRKEQRKKLKGMMGGR